MLMVSARGKGKRHLDQLGGGLPEIPHAAGDGDQTMQVHPRKFGKGILDYDCDLIRPYKDPVVFAFLLRGGHI